MEDMDAALKQFLSQFEPAAKERTDWRHGRLPLRAHFYLTGVLPPLEFVSSVRAILLRGDELRLQKSARLL